MLLSILSQEKLNVEYIYIYNQLKIAGSRIQKVTTRLNNYGLTDDYVEHVVSTRPGLSLFLLF